MSRVPNWPPARQQELVEVALEIETEIEGGTYHATPDELKVIDEGLAGKAASDKEVEAAFARFRRA